MQRGNRVFTLITSAFTLVESLVVIVITAILAAIPYLFLPRPAKRLARLTACP
jgi:prepilin-type N-terminal cleavage/methylation domain-containing protein